jgi:hypothetical protein
MKTMETMVAMETMRAVMETHGFVSQKRSRVARVRSVRFCRRRWNGPTGPHLAVDARIRQARHARPTLESKGAGYGVVNWDLARLLTTSQATN